MEENLLLTFGNDEERIPVERHRARLSINVSFFLGGRHGYV